MRRLWIPFLAAFPMAMTMIVELPLTQRFFLPPPETVRELTEVSRSAPAPKPPVIRDVVYHRDLLRRYHLDIYGPLPAEDGAAIDQPALQSAAPVIVFYHGGSWLRGDKITIMVIHRFLERLRREGWFVVSVNYTTSVLRGLGGPVNNATVALEWVHANAQRYGWDPRRVGLYGVSAGGHVALMAAAAGPETALVLAECAPTDLEAMRHGEAFENSSSFAVFPTWRLRALSPVHAVSQDYPPVLIYHGDADRTVDYRQAERLEAALTAVGGEVTLVRYPGGNHAFLNYSDQQWYEQETRAIAWMNEHFSSIEPPGRPR